MSLSTSAITSEDDFSPMFQGDTAIPFTPQFWKWNGDTNAYVALDISNYTPSMKMVSGTTTKTCAGIWTKPDPTNGKASYAWQSTDVDTAGTWILYIALTDGSNKVVHADTKELEIKGIPS